MRIIALLGAGALAVSTIAAAAPAAAQRGWDGPRDSRGWHGDRGWTGGRNWHRGERWRGDRFRSDWRGGNGRHWDRGRGWGGGRGGYYGRPRTVCRWVEGYYGPRRRCFRVR